MTPLLPPVASAGELTMNVIHNGDAFTILRHLPSNSVHCIVTSPPYYGLRDYGTAGQLGLEDTPQAYIARMVAIFREARRVLRDDGVLWLNMGDSFANDTKWGGSTGGKHVNALHGNTGTGQQRKRNTGFKPKDLMLMPHRLAIALQDDGWWVRQDNVWAKKNPMPEAVQDRTTRAHEYVFMLTKSAKYWYDADAVRVTGTEGSHGFNTAKGKTQNGPYAKQHANRTIFETPTAGRNLRSVWAIATESYQAAHFATFPRALPERCIKAACPAQTCAVCGTGWLRVVETSGGTIGQGWTDHKNDLSIGMVQAGGGLGDRKSEDGRPYQRQTLGFKPACECDTTATKPGITLDPFMGSGTVAEVARSLGRDYIGIELNPDYIELCKLRLGQKSRIDHLNAQEPADLSDLPMFGEEASA